MTGIMARIVFSIKASQEIIKSRGLDTNGRVQRLIDKEVLERCEPYIPKRSGALIESGRSSTKIGSGRISYSVPYARVQYYGITKSGKPMKYRGSSLRGAYWLERMKATHMPTIIALAAECAGAVAVNSGRNQKTYLMPKTQPIKTVLGNRRTPIF